MLYRVRVRPRWDHIFYIFTAAFVVRVVSAQAFPWRTDDSQVYVDIASNLLNSGRFAIMVNGAVTDTTARPPLYPAVLALMGLAEGPILLLQLVLSSLTVVLVYLMAKDFDKRIALLAAALFLIFPMANLYAAMMLTETLFVFF